MDSVGTKSYRQHPSGTLGFDAPAPHIVVVCPSCKTSFAVETAAVAALETPRFHCSRCDDIFVMKDAPSDLLPLGGVQVQSITSPGAQTRHSAARGRAPLPESLIKTSDFSLGNTASTSQPFHEADSSPWTEQPSRSELSLLNKRVDDPLETEYSAGQSTEWEDSFSTRQDDEDELHQDIEEVPPTKPREVSAPSRSGFLVASEPRQPTGHAPSSRQFVLADPPPVLGLQAEQVETKSAIQQPRPGPLKNSQPPTPTPQPKPQSPKTETYRPSPSAARRGDNATVDASTPQGRFSIRTQGLISMCTPIIGTVALLLGISYCARLSPHSIDALAQVVTPSFIQEPSIALPPRALVVKDLRLSLEKTRNKEIVPIARGVIANDSTRSFDDVELEVIGFNARGEIIASSRAPLRSALNSEKVSNLPLDAVRRYQTSLAAKSSLIGGQERVPFAIALLDSRHPSKEGELVEFDPSELRYFSARIFSVKR